MKTIFITSFHSSISRNILQTKVLTLLKERYRVVLLVPERKVDYFKKEFAGDQVVVEGVFMLLDSSDLAGRKWALVLLPTGPLFIKRRAKYDEDKNFFKYLAKILPPFLFGRFRFIVEALRYFDYKRCASKRFEKLFDKYKPDLVFSTDIQNEIDVNLLQNAKKIGVRTVGMVRSWDNLTCKGLMRFVPDRLIVENEISKNEAIKYNWVPPSRIEITGIPRYDQYHAVNWISRDDFLGELDFDSNRKTVFYAPIGDRYISDNQLDRLVIETLLELPLNVLVRLPPNDIVNLEGLRNDGLGILKIDKPGIRSWLGGTKSNELSLADDIRLRQTLSMADVVVAGPSTILVDGAFLGRPLVAVDFDEKERIYVDSVRRYYDYDHLRKAIESGGVAMARSRLQLLHHIDELLVEPELYREGRERIVKEQCFTRDAKSSERLTRAIDNILNDGR